MPAQSTQQIPSSSVTSYGSLEGQPASPRAERVRAIILAIVFKQVLQNVAQINEDFKEILHLMGGKCLSRKGILYRRLKAASVLGIRVVLVGGCSIAVKRGFKVAYACNVMDATVSLVVADPIRYLLGENRSLRVHLLSHPNIEYRGRRRQIFGGAAPIFGDFSAATRRGVPILKG
ncbi:hypothetical protein Fcan01_24134 [Folsomia candida]|uniref:Uncharacterized protein n=1 Tax=Folsomia candida TaxID=158441 RepID=A0A226D8M4_FOLCA|nr:hypothetical protein Fcan01_24134 [Folsomia candida]